MDILFAIDVSGSVGQSNFDLNKVWLEEIVKTDVSLNSRIGFTMFSTDINESRPMQYWEETDLLQYVRDIYYPKGWTATGALISKSLEQFETLKEPDREQLFVIQTDGNPCVAQSAGGCPHSVCQYEPILSANNIQTAMIGISGENSGLETQYVECITDYYFEVESYDDLDLLSDNYGLSDILCPENKLPNVTNTNETSGK